MNRKATYILFVILFFSFHLFVESIYAANDDSDIYMNEVKLDIIYANTVLDPLVYTARNNSDIYINGVKFDMDTDTALVNGILLFHYALLVKPWVMK